MSMLRIVLWPALATCLFALGTVATAQEKAQPQELWSLRPRGRAVPPTFADSKDRQWVRNRVDAFILAGRQKYGRPPGPEADRPPLTRRITFDLPGLPPTPAEIQAFVEDPAPDAYERLVERLLASPHYGERWGRHWLDVVRYA